MAKPIVMPKAGNSVEECLLSKWRVAVGDRVKAGDIVCDIETDKSAIEVEATAGGEVLALFGSEGDLIPVLQTILVVGESGEDVSSFAPSSGASGEAAESEVPVAPVSEIVESVVSVGSIAVSVGNAPMSPRARKFVKEHPFTVPSLTGSGAGGRILSGDVEAAYRSSPRLSRAAAAMVAAGETAPEQGSGVRGMIRACDFGGVRVADAGVLEGVELASGGVSPAPASPSSAELEDVVTEKPFPQIRKLIAGRLLESLNSMAQYTLNAEADVTGLLSLRRRLKAGAESLGLANINLGDMVMYSVIKALQRHPELNGEYGDHVVKLHSAINLGFACDTSRGLMVPVLHHSERLGLSEMCRRVKGMAKDANAGTLNPDLMSGATFTVSNLGSFGITTFTPVANAPQLAILGVGKTLLRPVRGQDGSVEYRDYMQFSLTLNHMVIDGAPGARFLQTLKEIVENFELVCIAG